MDRKTIRKEIISLVNSIKVQSDLLADEKYPSQLDLELFLHKVERLYQKSIVFNHLSLFDGFEEADAVQQPVEVKRVLPEKEESELVENVVPIPPVDKIVSPLAVPIEPPVTTTQPVIEEKKEEISPEKQKENQPTVTITTKKTMPDLKATIGLNDKFQFTNELFKGNMQEFNIAIEQLNASQTPDSAREYLISLEQLYNWDLENETVKRLFSIVERRYAS